MHLAILGATGGTGRQLTTQALDRGHTVTAVARRPGDVAITHQCLNVAQGDVYDSASLSRAIQGADAAIYAVGVANIWQARKPTTIYSKGVKNLLQAMEQVQVRRVLVISSSGTDPKPGDPWWFTAIVKPLFLKQMYADMRRMEAMISASPALWTIVRPPQLVDGPWTGVYRTARNGTVPNDEDLSRGDLAHFILNEVEQSHYINAKVDIAY